MNALDNEYMGEIQCRKVRRREATAMGGRRGCWARLGDAAGGQLKLFECDFRAAGAHLQLTEDLDGRHRRCAFDAAAAAVAVCVGRSSTVIDSILGGQKWVNQVLCIEISSPSNMMDSRGESNIPSQNRGS